MLLVDALDLRLESILFSLNSFKFFNKNSVLDGLLVIFLDPLQAILELGSLAQ